MIFRPYRTAKILRLRYSRCRQKILISGPPQIPEAQIKSFIDQSKDWLQRYFPSPHIKKSLGHGVVFPFLGENLTVHHHSFRSASIIKQGSILHVIGPLLRIERIIFTWLKTQALGYFEEICRIHAPLLNVNPQKIIITNAQTRWGSCNTKATLSFSWRLVFAPLEISHYVAIHELCHLKEMNHGAAFWSLVEAHYPAYKKAQKWLKENGPTLHLWGSASGTLHSSTSI